MTMTSPKKPTIQELDDMLRVLGDTPMASPSAEIRENLLRMTSVSRGRVVCNFGPPAQQPHRLRWAFWSMACAAVLVGIGLHYLNLSHKAALPHTVGIAHIETAHNSGSGSQTQITSPRKVILHKLKRVSTPASQKGLSESTSFNRELPYSNPDIANGTHATIRVAVSREELVALGFPFNEAAADGKYLAEIVLGDDGLPRSIRVPLPLRSFN